MTDTSRSDNAKNELDPDAGRRILRGCLAGGAIFLGIMILLAGITVASGVITDDAAGRLNLEPWLVVEVIGGALASVLAGAVSRRVARHYRGPMVLAVCVFSIGVLEATEILSHSAAGRVNAPGWLVLLAPCVAPAGVLLGGWRPRMGTDRRRTISCIHLGPDIVRYSLPALVFVGTTALSLLVFPGPQVGAESQIVAAALSFDFTVTVPGLVFLLLVRARRAPWIALIPTFLVGYATAAFTIPSQHHAVLDTIGVLLVPAELCVVVYLVVLTRRALAGAALGDGDFATRFRFAARKVLASRIPADILTTEISILYYAFGWRPPSTPCTGSYTVYREVSYLAILTGLTMVLAVETVAVHLLLSLVSNTAAWILTCLSIYACIWLVGDFRAMAARPLQITPTQLSIRVGIRWEADIPLARIELVELLYPNKGPRNKATLVAAVLGQPNLRLRLTGPTEVTGMYGIRRIVNEIWLTVDGAANFCTELRSAIAT